MDRRFGQARQRGVRFNPPIAGQWPKSNYRPLRRALLQQVLWRLCHIL
jgi:hypothetical protein